MSDLLPQLDLLRKRMAAASARAAQRVEARLAERTQFLHTRLEDVVPGVEVQTSLGVHYEVQHTWEHYRRHGNVDIGRLRELPPDLLTAMDQLPASPPHRWAFLDTETTGLVGGAGTCAFLVGIGRITPDGFRVRQFFMRDYPEEASMLDAIRDALASVDILITYNGKCFDIPLLETRYRLARSRPPFSRLPHLDLLYGARRLWRLRFDSCKLTELESRILGHERHDDVPGDLIPQIFFDYVRTGRALRLAPVFKHNALDIVTLACLTGVVPWAFHPSGAAQLTHGAELVSLARWLRQAGQWQQARQLLRSALQRHLPDHLLFRSLWDLAEMEKKLAAFDAALAIYTDLAQSPNPYQAPALEQLAKHYEHREKNYPLALHFTRQALALAPSPSLQQRQQRLLRRLSLPQTAPLL